MGIFDKLKNLRKDKDSKKKDKKEAASKDQVKKEKTEEKKDYQSLQPKGELAPGLKTVPAKEVKSKRIKKDDTKDAYKVLIRPIVTEKATDLAQANKYAFEVAINTNKIEVKKAIKSLYGVDPIDVKIIRMRGKKVSYRRLEGKKKNWKKAIVTLKQGDKIELYEGV